MEQLNSKEPVVKVICPDCGLHAEYSFVDGVLECKLCPGNKGRFKFGKHPTQLKLAV